MNLLETNQTNNDVLLDQDNLETVPDHEELENILDQENEIYISYDDSVIFVDDLPVLYMASEETVVYNDQLSFISSNLQVLNTIVLVIAGLLVAQLFTRIFIKFFGWDLV